MKPLISNQFPVYQPKKPVRKTAKKWALMIGKNITVMQDSRWELLVFEMNKRIKEGGRFLNIKPVK